MQVTEEVIRSVVQEVLSHMGPTRMTSKPAVSSDSGVFDDVDAAVRAASAAQCEFERRSLNDRRKAITCIRNICIEQANTLGKMEFEETKIGRIDHKIEKLKLVGEKIPGVEFLQTDAFSGENGITLTEYAPFGVIGVITPVTHSLPTLAGNAINMLAGGNTLVCNAHPSGNRIAAHGTRLFNQAIRQAIGIDNLITIIGTPTLESAQ